MTTRKASILAAIFFLAYIVMLIVGSLGFFMHGGNFTDWNLWPTWVRTYIWIPMAGLIASKLIIIYLLWKDDEKLKSALLGLAGVALLFCMISFPWFFLILLFLAVLTPILAMAGIGSREITDSIIIIIIIGPLGD